MYATSIPYTTTTPSESWSALAGSSCLGSDNTFSVSPLKIHSGMNVEELRRITNMRLEGKTIYYELPFQHVDMSVYATGLYGQPSGYYIDSMNYGVCDDSEEVRDTRAWSTFSNNSADSVLIDGPFSSDISSDYDGSPIRSFNPSSLGSLGTNEDILQSHFADKSLSLPMNTAVEFTPSKYTENSCLNVFGSKNSIDIDAFFDFSVNYDDACSKSIREASSLTASPIRA